MSWKLQGGVECWDCTDDVKLLEVLGDDVEAEDEDDIDWERLADEEWERLVTQAKHVRMLIINPK